MILTARFLRRATHALHALTALALLEALAWNDPIAWVGTAAGAAASMILGAVARHYPSGIALTRDGALDPDTRTPPRRQA